MNITKESIDALNAVVKIEVEPSDYQPRVNETIKKYQRTASVPGFRPGKTPAGIIKKMYGKAVMIEELNHLLSESLGKYIYDNKLDILGSPLPKARPGEDSWEDGKTFEFLYELGMAPSVEVDGVPGMQLPYYAVIVDDTMVTNDVDDLRRRYGKFSNPEVSADGNILYADFAELDASSQVVEGGVQTTTTLALDMIRDEAKRKQLIGLKKDDTLTFNPYDTLSNETEVAAMLKVGKDSPALRADYRMTVKTINNVEKADLNQEFFDKIYGEGVVTSEEEFRNKVKEGIVGYFERQSDMKLKKDLRNRLLETISVPLPDDFLKRMLIATQEKPVDDFEHHYYHVAEDLRWSLILGRLAQAYEVTVNEEEVRVAARQAMQQQFYQYGVYNLDDARLDEMTTRYLSESNNKERTERSLLDQKVFAAVKPLLSLDRQESAYEEFLSRLNEKTAHEHEHHH